MKNVIKSVLFVGILIFLLEFSAYIMLPQKNIKKYGLFNIANYEILSETENTIDTVIIGDSLVYSAYIPMEIWHNYGYTTFDCANAAQLIKDSYKTLDYVIQSQHPKIVFFEANVLYRNPKNKSWYLKIYHEFQNSMPILNYHNNWKKFLFNFTNDGFNEINVNKGYKLNKTVKKGKTTDYMHVTNKVKEIPEINQEYFAKMVKLCKDNDVKLVLLSTPSMKVWNYGKHEGALELASKYDVEYLDLNLAGINIDWSKESKDKGDHLNYEGALKVSDYFGKYLQSLGIFEDHRNDKNYASWQECYESYQQNL